MKKIISIILSIAALTSSAFAAESEIAADLNGVFEAHNPVAVSHNLQSEAAISWQTSDTATGTFTELSTEQVYTVGYKDSGKWLKAVLTYIDGVIETEPVQINASWIKKLTASELAAGAIKNTSDANKFSVGGMDFVLLDVTRSSESKFMAVTANSVGTRGFSEIETVQQGYQKQHFYDMAAFLNNLKTVNSYFKSNKVKQWENIDYTSTGYLGNKDYVQIPQAVQEYINQKHVWKIEPAKTGVDYEYNVEAGIVLPAVTEIEKYSELLGWGDIGSYWTRTPSNTSDGEALIVDASGDKGKTVNKINTEAFQIRPEFYLGEDFFRNVKLEKIGSNVMQKISEIYTKEELLKLYTEQELKDMGYKACIMKDVKFIDGDITSSSVEIDFLCGESETKQDKIMLLYYDAGKKLVGAYVKNISTQAGENQVTVETPSVAAEADSVNIVLVDKASLQPVSDSISK